jgi:Ser/Thr protein kinase RdoA (MazF antagonist)
VFAVRLGFEPSPPGIEWEHAVVTALAAEIPEIPAPVPAADGATWFRHGDVAVWLLPFVEGRPADVTREAHRLEAAAPLGRLHAAGAGIAAPRPDVRPLRELAWPDPPLRDALVEHAHALPAARAWAIDFVAGLRSRPLATGLIHGDFFRGNVLLAGHRAIGLLEWEEATVDWQAYDLANGVWEFCHQGGDDFERADGERFVAAYREAGGTVPPREDDLLGRFIRVRRMMEVLRAPTDRHVDWDYHHYNMRAFANLA